MCSILFSKKVDKVKGTMISTVYSFEKFKDRHLNWEKIIRMAITPSLLHTFLAILPLLISTTPTSLHPEGPPCLQLNSVV